MYVIVGLGNPGSRYANTRHNVGFMTIDTLAEKKQIQVTKSEHQGLTGTFRVGGERVMLVKPQTYMNESGKCVGELVRFYKVDLDHLIVIYDDIDLDPGHLRIRKKGGAGTHNGMRSVVGALGSGDFPRIRIGVGAQPPQWDLADYVLENLSGDTQKTIMDAVGQAAKAAEMVVTDGIDLTMNRMNRH
jgi:PTH1 family peptidyl-tRNA hydrolase